MNREISIDSAGGGAFEAYLALPPSTPAPGLLLLPAIFGIEPVMRAMADRYAAGGYVVLVPNQFWRDEQPGVLARTAEARAAAMARAKRVDPAAVLADVASAVDALRALPECSGEIAVLGICFGGRYAYLAAARLPVQAAATYHGTLIGTCLPELPRAPIALHYGDQDPVAPIGEVRAIEDAVRDVPEADVYVYPGASHNFSIPGEPHYDPEVTRLAEERTFALFDALKARPLSS
ncbi:MAG TPA: dienelactone hydrolase family protein [Candidatus Elarobacter sp.]|jgi:carboxymethylenebutenolidase|nr:dienelactone hydrolase family protein [Candidatus Elarobacter sp.]